MVNPLRLGRRWGRSWRLYRVLLATESCETERIRLRYPARSWYSEHAGELLHLVDEVAAQLEAAMELTLPRPTGCYILEPEAIEALYHAAGVACHGSVLVGMPARHPAELASVAAHELGHILASDLGSYRPRFKGEGFACYAAWRIGAAKLPMGLPLHYVLKWRSSVGIPTRLEDLWRRRDVTPELYDLACSFVAFVVMRFGRDCYYEFYRSPAESLAERVEATLGVSVRRLERDWHEHAEGVPLDGSQISRLHRETGVMCSRAGWMRSQRLSREKRAPL